MILGGNCKEVVVKGICMLKNQRVVAGDSGKIGEPPNVSAKGLLLGLVRMAMMLAIESRSQPARVLAHRKRGTFQGDPCRFLLPT